MKESVLLLLLPPLALACLLPRAGRISPSASSLPPPVRGDEASSESELCKELLASMST